MSVGGEARQPDASVRSVGDSYALRNAAAPLSQQHPVAPLVGDARAAHDRSRVPQCEHDVHLVVWLLLPSAHHDAP
jgi:hypothetical protein